MDQTYNQMFEHLRQMRDEMDRAKARLRQKMISVEHGPVRLQVNGYQEVVSVSLAPSSVSDTRELEKAIASAINSAMDRSRNMVIEEMGRFMGGILPPGFGPAFDE